MSAHDMQLWENGEMDAPPSNWMTATFNDALWPAADDMFVLGTGPWGGGHNANFPATAQWMWTSESVGHNDIFCRILIPCGTDVLYSMDFEGMGDVQEAFYGQGVGTAPASAVLAADAERGTSAKTGRCIGGGDAYSIDTFMCTFEEPCLVTYWQKGNAWQGFAEGFPGPHTWTAVPDDYPGQHISTRKTSTWSYVQYVFPTSRIDSGAPDDGSTGLDVHVHGGGQTGAKPLRFMFEAFSGSSSGAGSLCDNTWFDDIMITPTLPPVPPTTSPCPDGPIASYSAFKFNLDPADDKTGLRGWDCCIQIAEINLYDGNGAWVPGAVASNPVGLEPLRPGGYCDNDGTAQNPGQNPCGELPSNGVDGNVDALHGCINCDHKWLDFTRGDLIMTFDGVKNVQSYDWLTANDAPNRDPVRGLYYYSPLLI
jgi:hypothetical protein